VIHGHVRDNFPYVALSLPGRHGVVTVEFLVDTAFDGHLSLPPSVIHRLVATYSLDQRIRTATGTETTQAAYEVEIDFGRELRTIIVLELDNDSPLLGALLLTQNLVTLEMTDGGEVTIEPL